MAIWKVRLTALSDLLVSSGPGLHNERFGLDYIPGRTLKGALARICLSRNAASSDYETFARIFCRDEVRFSNLYPACGAEKARPVPKSAITVKRRPGFRGDQHYFRRGDGVLDEILFPEEVGCLRDKEAVERMSGWYVNENGQLSVVHPSISYVMHNRITPSTGTTGEAGVYSDRGLAAGSEYRGQISGPRELLKQLLDWLGLPHGNEHDLNLGIGSKRGEANLHGYPLIDSQDEPDGGPTIEKDGGHFLLLNCVSDVILLDPFLRYLPYVPASTLEAELGLESESLELVRHFSGTRLVSGWYTAWGLPRSVDVAIEKGSCFLYKLLNDAPANLGQTCASLADRGLGLCTGDGFGEVTFHEPFHRLALSDRGEPL